MHLLHQHPPAPRASLFWKAQPERIWLRNHHLGFKAQGCQCPGSPPDEMETMTEPSTSRGCCRSRRMHCAGTGSAWGAPGMCSRGRTDTKVPSTSDHLTSQTPPPSTHTPWPLSGATPNPLCSLPGALFPSATQTPPRSQPQTSPNRLPDPPATLSGFPLPGMHLSILSPPNSRGGGDGATQLSGAWHTVGAQ